MLHFVHIIAGVSFAIRDGLLIIDCSNIKCVFFMFKNCRKKMRNRFFFGGPKERVFLQRVLKIRDPREAEYVQLMHDFGHYSGFQDLKKTVIVERLV